MDGEHSVAEIAAAVWERFPGSVRTLREAYQLVAKEIEVAQIAPQQRAAASALSGLGGET